MGKYLVGVDVGGTKTAYGLFDADGHLISSCRQATDCHANPDSFVRTVSGSIKTMLCNHDIPISSVSGIGIGMPSYINFEKGYVVLTSALPSLKEFPARQMFEEALGTRVELDNDANAAALAELRFGAGRGFRHLIFAVIGTGIGAGIIIDGKLFRGTYGSAGEIGHMLITPDLGFECGCGNSGCFMSHASGLYVAKYAVHMIENGMESIMPEMAGCMESIDGKVIRAAYEKGDKLAGLIVERIGYYTGILFFNLYQALNINCFVIGGGLVKMGPALLDIITKTFNRYNNQKDLPVYFLPAELDDHVGIIGASQLVV